jgi:predicted lipoprotein with Yx(FWY)xxD motif
MNLRTIAVPIVAALASVPLIACGSSADARPAVPATAAQAMPAVHSRPATLDRPAAAHRPAEQATSPIRQHSVRGPIVRLGRVGGYRALVDGAGRALYLFTPDRRGHSVCYAGCARMWPPLYGRARPGPGIHPWALAFTIRRDGRAQPTYHGHPLYHYSGDRRPGQARGQGLDGTWYLVDLMGNAIGGWRRPVR